MNRDPWPELRRMVERAKAHVIAEAHNVAPEIDNHLTAANREHLTEYRRRARYQLRYPDLRDPIEATALDEDYAMRRRAAKALVIEIWAWNKWKSMKRKREDELVELAAATRILTRQAN